MNTSCHFADINHVLALRALSPDVPPTSEMMARSVHTYPVVVGADLGPATSGGTRGITAADRRRVAPGAGTQRDHLVCRVSSGSAGSAVWTAPACSKRSMSGWAEHSRTWGTHSAGWSNSWNAACSPMLWRVLWDVKASWLRVGIDIGL